MNTQTDVHVCGMEGCGRVATWYGGYRGAGDWAGYVCGQHTRSLAWRERVPGVPIDRREERAERRQRAREAMDRRDITGGSLEYQRGQWWYRAEYFLWSARRGFMLGPQDKDPMTGLAWDKTFPHFSRNAARRIHVAYATECLAVAKRIQARRLP